ncbi:hypothetical protein ACFW1A_32810 [Kitasatospora sp. NPDC058965]|uniref:Rv1733c family protein n=1 Tax=Kitasatospora sp. NPDC058965 TaxID=3346682 RepID=UPI00367A2ED8
MSAASAPGRPSTPRTPALAELRRAIGRERNPLCRRLDRSRSRLLLALVFAVVASVAVAVLVGVTVLRSGQAQDRQLQAHRHRVSATTTDAAVASSDPALNGRAQAPAVWTYPPTGRGSGLVTVPIGTPSGATVTAVLDDHGNPVAPQDVGGPLANALLLGSTTLLAGWMLTDAGFSLRRRALDRRADRDWDADWELVEPSWSGRHRPRPGTGQA